MHWIYLIHEFHNLSWITEINELFHDIPTVNISKRNFWLIICITKDNFKGDIFQYFYFFAPSDSRYSNSCISAKYCPIITNHISMESLFIQLTRMIVVQGHIILLFHQSALCNTSRRRVSQPYQHWQNKSDTGMCVCVCVCVCACVCV